jgi:hypothetical protein
MSKVQEVVMPGQMPRPAGRPMTQDEARADAFARRNFIEAAQGGCYAGNKWEPHVLPDISRKAER